MKGILLTAAVAVALSCSQSFAADGNVSSNALAKMGLSNVKVMSDAEGMQVRGKLAIAWGQATASAQASGNNGVAGATATPGYLSINPNVSWGVTAAAAGAGRVNNLGNARVAGAIGFSIAGGF